MSSPPFDASGQGPTHGPLSPQATAKLAEIIERSAAGRPIKCSTIDKLAEEHGVPASHFYIAAASRPTIEFAREQKVVFVVCGGGCQDKGAQGCLQHLVELRRPRLKKWFKKAFDIQTRLCLNRCDHGPAVRIDTRDGAAYLDRATPEDLSEAVETLCG